MGQTSTSPESGTQRPEPSTHRSPSLWRWVARVFLALVWSVFVAIIAGVASYIGGHAGSTIIPLQLLHVISHVREQPIIVLVGLTVTALALLGILGWLTYLAFMRLRDAVLQKDLVIQSIASRNFPD